MATEYEMIQILSGKNELDNAKVGISLIHELIGSDGDIREIEFYYTQKPEVRIFRDYNNLCLVDLVYEFPDDKDLLQQWLLLSNFFKPENSVNFTDEEMDLYQQQVSLREEGIIPSAEEEIVLHDHKLTLNIISLFPHGKYSFTSIDTPLYYTLVPTWPDKPPTTLRFLFQRDDVVFEEKEDEDVVIVNNEALSNIERELEEYVDVNYLSPN